MFWVFGSLFQRRCGAPLASCCGSVAGAISRRFIYSGLQRIFSSRMIRHPHDFRMLRHRHIIGCPDIHTGQGPHDRRMIRHPHDFRMFRHPHIYRMSRHPHGPRATQPSDDLPSTRVSSADANTGQGPHSTGDDPKTGHPNISEDPWWVAGKLSVLTWFRSCRLGSGCPSVGLSCFVFCPVTGVCLFLLGRQPEDWPFTGFLHCQRLCESGSRRLCRTIGAGTPCTDIPSKNLARAASQGFHSGVHGPVCTGAPRFQRHGATERARGISASCVCITRNALARISSNPLTYGLFTQVSWYEIFGIHPACSDYIRISCPGCGVVISLSSFAISPCTALSFLLSSSALLL